MKMEDNKQEKFVNTLREVVKDEVQPIRDDVTKFKDEILDGQDKIIKKLDDLELEDMAHTAQHDRQQEKLDEHGKRINQLEVKLGVV